MRITKSMFCVIISITLLICAATPISAANPLAAPPSAGIQWVSTDAASATLTVIDGLVSISTTINGKMNIATRVEVDVKLYRLDNGEWRDCGIAISDAVDRHLYTNTWQRRVVLRGTYQAVVTVHVYSPYGVDEIVMYPTDIY